MFYWKKWSGLSIYVKGSARHAIAFTCLFITNYFHFLNQSARLECNFFFRIASLADTSENKSVSLLRFLSLKYQLPQIQHGRKQFARMFKPAHKCMWHYPNGMRITHWFSSWKALVSMSPKVSVSCDIVHMFLKSCINFSLWWILLPVWLGAITSDRCPVSRGIAMLNDKILKQCHPRSISNYSLMSLKYFPQHFPGWPSSL